VRGKSVRYAKPVVEKTSSRREDSTVKSPGFREEDESADRETIGRDENEVDIVPQKMEK
jgi:hypothetical protein